MVQKQVLNKLGIQANYILKTEKRQAITKPFLQNYDAKSKGGDMKTMRMKKHRSIKRSDVEFGLHSSMNGGHEVVEQPGKPPTLATTIVTTTKPYSQIQLGSATKTPSPKKTSPWNNSTKSPYGSPNYMKSTSSSEARKENNNSNTSKFHRARETLGKTSSLKKVRTLTKAPSFKHTSNKKVVLCEDIDVQRATCSSTLKDSKFPPYLKLQPGATEAQGTSVMKVCPYTYCSLNGHHHSSAPPLKYFLSSRRKLLKTQKNSNLENIIPCKKEPSEIQVKQDGSEIAETRKEENFVEIYVPGKEDLVAVDDAVQVSESLSDEGACSEIDYQEGTDQSDENRNLTVSNFISQGDLDEDFPAEEVEFSGGESDAEVDTVSTVSLDQFFCGNSDMEWEDVRVPESHEEKADDSVQSNCGNEEDELVSEFDFLAWKLLPYIHDEIMECLQFSDADSSSDSEFTRTDDEQSEEQSSDDETIKLGEESTEEQEDCFLNSAEEVYEAQIEGLISVEEPNENNGDYLNEENHIVDATTEGNNTEIVMEEGESNDCPVADRPAETEDVQFFAAAESQAEGVESETAQSVNPSFGITAECPLSGENAVSEQEDNKGSIGVAATTEISELEYDSDEVKFRSIENDIGEDEVSETEDINTTVEEGTSTNSGNKSQEIRKCNSQRMKNSTDELQNCCNKLKISIRSKKADEGSDAERDFNLRPPNFLPVEPEPDAEKVDLRHQEMDERRNSEEWMLDYALQKTVNQLGPARKRKVSLLVQAFESVLPASKYEPQMRRSSSTFSHPRPIQACS